MEVGSRKLAKEGLGEYGGCQSGGGGRRDQQRAWWEVTVVCQEAVAAQRSVKPELWGGRREQAVRARKWL